MFLNGQYYGALDELRNLPADGVEEVRFFTGPDAVTKFGSQYGGGIIQVQANDSADEASREHIRMHLTHIAKAFSNGDFDIPGFVHDTVPPGVPELKRLKSKVHYSFEQSANGGRVLILTSDSDALAAIHKFLRFQITEHKTGDPLDVK